MSWSSLRAFWLVGRTERLHSSVALLDGEMEFSELASAVTIERDALGVPTIRGSKRLDVARGLGFLHAQERFFQMDLMRRQAAGELSEIFGAGALEADRASRMHQFRQRARRVIETMPETEKVLVGSLHRGCQYRPRDSSRKAVRVRVAPYGAGALAGRGFCVGALCDVFRSQRRHG